MRNKLVLFMLALVLLISTACNSNSDEQEADNNNGNTTVDEVEGDSDENNQEKNQNEENEDVFVSSNQNDEAQTSKNLLDKTKVFKYEDEAVTLSIESATFTREFTPSEVEDEADGESRKVTSDSEIYLHLTGNIDNNTKDRFSYGHKLGSVNFKLVYDETHEFEALATTEEENGTKFGSSNIDPLSEEKIHIYFQVPQTVSESTESLKLEVISSDDTFEIDLR